jgi:hypothetical protein
VVEKYGVAAFLQDGLEAEEAKLGLIFKNYLLLQAILITDQLFQRYAIFLPCPI